MKDLGLPLQKTTHCTLFLEMRSFTYGANTHEYVYSDNNASLYRANLCQRRVDSLSDSFADCVQGRGGFNTDADDAVRELAHNHFIQTK
jgi:hypothetical protein